MLYNYNSVELIETVRGLNSGGTALLSRTASDISIDIQPGMAGVMVLLYCVENVQHRKLL